MVPRAVVTALLLLVVSPVTAPFLTFDLGDLPGDAGPTGAAVIQSKKAHDEPIPTFVAPPTPQPVRASFRPPVLPPRQQVHTSRPAHVPLRI